MANKRNGNTNSKTKSNKKTVSKSGVKKTDVKTNRKPAAKKTTTKKTTVKKAPTNKTMSKKNNNSKKTTIKKVETKQQIIKKNKKEISKAKLIKLGIWMVEIIILLAIFTSVLVLALKKPKVKINTVKASFKVVDRTNKIKTYKKENEYTIVGWIKIQGTNIDYPVLFYDTAPISDVRQNIGWMYEKPKKLKERTVVEGHNILNMSANPSIADKDSKRFEQLMSFSDENFVKSNKYIEYSTENENYVFKIFAVGFPEHQVYYTKSDFTEEEKKEYIDSAIKNSLYKFDVEVNEKDKIISLYTCTRYFGYNKSVSFRVDGRLLRKGEHITNYDMETTKEYEVAKSHSAAIKKKQEVKS